MHTHTHAHTHTQTAAHSHSLSLTHTHAHAHTRTHAHARTHTHTKTHTYTQCWHHISCDHTHQRCKMHTIFYSQMPLNLLVLWCVAVCCSMLQCAAVLLCVAVCCSVLQCVAVCGSVWQCVAVCCSFLFTKSPLTPSSPLSQTPFTQTHTHTVSHLLRECDIFVLPLSDTRILSHSLSLSHSLCVTMQPPPLNPSHSVSSKNYKKIFTPSFLLSHRSMFINLADTLCNTL